MNTDQEEEEEELKVILGLKVLQVCARMRSNFAKEKKWEEVKYNDTLISKIISFCEPEVPEPLKQKQIQVQNDVDEVCSQLMANDTNTMSRIEKKIGHIKDFTLCSVQKTELINMCESILTLANTSTYPTNEIKQTYQSFIDKRDRQLKKEKNRDVTAVRTYNSMAQATKKLYKAVEEKNKINGLSSIRKLKLNGDAKNTINQVEDSEAKQKQQCDWLKVEEESKTITIKEYVVIDILTKYLIRSRKSDPYCQQLCACQRLQCALFQLIKKKRIEPRYTEWTDNVYNKLRKLEDAEVEIGLFLSKTKTATAIAIDTDTVVT